jgi:signal transduction histidine kinase
MIEDPRLSSPSVALSRTRKKKADRSPAMKNGLGDSLRNPPELRLLQAERSEEVYPILLEEIVKLGYERTFILAADFETGEVVPTASVNCSAAYLQRFRTSLFAAGNRIIELLHSQQPRTVSDSSLHHRALYCHPIIFNNVRPCWEAQRERRTTSCLAVDNAYLKRKLRIDQQVCSACSMRAYAGLVAIELPKPQVDVAPLGTLINLANRYLSRLFKVEHYYNSMTDMELSIAQLQKVMQSMTDPVILTDNHYRVIVQNKAAERFFRVPESNVTEGFVRAVELNTLLFSAALSSMTVSGEERSRDLTLVDAYEGEEILFEAACTTTFGRDRQPLGIVSVLRDVTDLRRADQELRENYDKLRQAEEAVRQDRDRLNLIIENVGDPIIVCDNAAHFVLLDPLAKDLFGSDNDSLRDELRVKNHARFDAYISTFTFGFEERASGGLKFFDPGTKTEAEYDARSEKIFDERGLVSYTVTVLRDLSALRRIEQLKTEQRMMEIERFASAGRLAATIAHEVNNPMEAIKNAVYLFAEFTDPEHDEVCDILRSETERVARIVRQMLGLYRSNEQLKEINVNTLIEDTLLLLNRQLQNSNVTVLTQLDELPSAIVAADQWRQVFSNLVVNAKDAMFGGGTLTIRTRYLRSDSKAQGRIIITVADTGQGIPPHLMPILFEPFVTTKGEKGAGLGLWIVQGVVANHAGKIKLHSTVGRGTVVRIQIPLMR